MQDWTQNALALIDLGTVQIISFFVSLIKAWLSKRKIKQNESWRRKLVKGSVLLSNKKKNSESLCTDCNYCTFSECGCLQLQTITSAHPWVMTPSLFHCLNKGRMSAGIINERENMQGTHSPFWPPWILCLTSLKSIIDCFSIATHAHKIHIDSIPLWPIQENWVLSSFFLSWWVLCRSPY